MSKLMKGAALGAIARSLSQDIIIALNLFLILVLVLDWALIRRDEM